MTLLCCSTARRSSSAAAAVHIRPTGYLSMVESTCSESRLYGHLANIYAEMQSHLPPRQSIYAAISSLIKSGLIYYCGESCSLVMIF
ncbi:hypothetical protein ACTXT7_004973 [Hymenolepis weldensis]